MYIDIKAKLLRVTPWFIFCSCTFRRNEFMWFVVNLIFQHGSR
jgi:hypothetical protein